MKCPACSQEFDLTWRRYFAAPFGKHPCPSCDSPLRWKHRWFYWPVTQLTPLVAAVPPMVVLIARNGPLIGMALGIVICGAVYFPLDRYMESRFSAAVLVNGSPPA